MPSVAHILGQRTVVIRRATLSAEWPPHTVKGQKTPPFSTEIVHDLLSKGDVDKIKEFNRTQKEDRIPLKLEKNSLEYSLRNAYIQVLLRDVDDGLFRRINDLFADFKREDEVTEEDRTEVRDRLFKYLLRMEEDCKIDFQDGKFHVIA